MTKELALILIADATYPSVIKMNDINLFPSRIKEFMTIANKLTNDIKPFGLSEWQRIYSVNLIKLVREEYLRIIKELK